MNVKGTLQAQMQADQIDYIKGQGDTVTHTWHGTKSAILGLKGLLAYGGYQNITISSNDNITYILRATEPNTEVVCTWELLGSAIQEDIYTHPKSRALTDSQLKTIKEADQNPEQSDGSVLQLTGDAYELWNLVRNHQYAYQKSQWILRQTATFGAWGEFQVAVSIQDTEKVFATFQLPPELQTDSPGVYAAVMAIPTPDDVPPGYNWGWLKQTPTFSQSYGGKLQFTQEWWLYLWSEYVYPKKT